MPFRLGFVHGIRTIHYVARAAPKSASAPARRVSESFIVLCTTHFANSRARTLDVFPTVLGDSLLRFGRFCGDRATDDARSRLSSTIVGRALPGLDNYRRLLGLDRSSIAEEKFLEGFVCWSGWLESASRVGSVTDHRDPNVSNNIQIEM